MATRRAARERALGLAYESELRGLPAAALIADQPVAPDEYACRIVLGADANRDEIDAVIRKYSEHWSLERMPVIDRGLPEWRTAELRCDPQTRGSDPKAMLNKAEHFAVQ